MTLRVEWLVGRGGVVLTVQLREATADVSEATAACVREQIHGWEFPREVDADTTDWLRIASVGMTLGVAP